MRVVVDRYGVVLRDPEEFTRFEIVTRVDPATTRARLRAAGAGVATAGGEIAVPFGFVRFAAGSVAETPGWREGFDKMIGYATTKGWITPDAEILGHVVQDDSAAPSYRAAVVGLGVQGSGLVQGLRALGHDVVAGVDVGDLVGRALSDVVPGFEGPAEVLGSVGELIRAFPDLDVVVLAASVGRAVTLEWAGDLVEHGIDVVSLDHEVFAYDASWVAALDARAGRDGGSFMGVGVQDVAWVQLMGVAGAAVAGATKVSLVNRVPIEVLPEGLLLGMGAGGSAAEYAAATAGSGPESSVISGPLVEAARHLGATPGPVATEVAAVIGAADYDWIAGGRVLPAGTVQGVRETASFDTDLGIRFEGVIEIVPGGEEAAENVVEIAGDPDLRVTFGPITTSVTNTALLSRIPDVVAAPPGAVFSADLAPARYQAPRSA